MNRPAQLESRLPCAVLRLWWLDRDGELQSPDSLPDQVITRPEETHEVGEGAYAVVPRAGDPAVFDAATDWARHLELESKSAPKAGERRLSPLTVIYPGVVSIGGDRAVLEPDDLDADLGHQRPKLEAGVYLSGRAAKMLEYIPTLGKGVSYQGQSGKALPLMRFEGPQYDGLPWRNPEVLGQSTEYVVRQQLSEGFTRLLQETAARVSGALGCGKTRLVWEGIMRQDAMRLWIRARPPRIGAPIVSEQLITQLLIPSEQQLRDPQHPRFDAQIDGAQIREALSNYRGRRSEAEIRLLNERATLALKHLAQKAERQVWIVIDDFHQINPHDLAFLEHLLETADLTIFRFVLVGRSGSPWPGSLEALPILEIPPLADHEMKELASRVTAGLSIPDAVEQRFLEATLGCPFAFEEALFALVHEKYLRRIYGSFFFGGSHDLECQPSSRLVRHVEAEVSRLGEPLPVRLLSITEHPVPASELASAASILGRAAEPEWEKPFIEARILDNVESPWGHGVRIASPVNRRALSHSLPQERAIEARRALGELLSLGGSGGESHWLSYRLLSGLPEAIDPLMRLFKTQHLKQIPPEELLGALERELQGLRNRRVGGSGDSSRAPGSKSSESSESRESADIELELLWRMLPLARRMGRLSKYESDLARGVELSTGKPQRLLGLASIKAEQDQKSGRFQAAESTIQSALKAAGSLEARHKALLLMQLGRLFLRQNRLDETEQLFSNLLKALDETQAPALSASCRFYLGNVALHRGNLEAAHAFHLAALEQRQESKLNKAVGISLSALGAVATAQGLYPQALEYYRQSLDLFKKHSKTGDDSYALIGLARAYGRIGDFHAATKPARRALELRTNRYDIAGEAVARLAVAMNYLDLGQSDSALEEARKAHFQLTLSSEPSQLAETEMTLGMIHLRQGRYSDARLRFEKALEHFRELHKPLETTLVLAYLVEVGVAQEDAEAIRMFTTELKNELNENPPPDQGEILDFRVYSGLQWLSKNGFKVGNPSAFLARAYKSVMSKAENLNQDLRQRYLFRIPANQEIVDSATREGLTTAD